MTEEQTISLNCYSCDYSRQVWATRYEIGNSKCPVDGGLLLMETIAPQPQSLFWHLWRKIRVKFGLIQP